MKIKKNIIILLFIIILTITIGTLIIENITKNNKDYEGWLAVNKQQQNISIFVLPAIPVITIISPKNTTYSTANLLLNYSIENDADSIWYNLDNRGNITINSPLQFITTEGSHSLYLYASNIFGTSGKSIFFSVEIPASPPPPEEDRGRSSGGYWTENKTEEQEENITEPEIPRDITNPKKEKTINILQVIIFVLISIFILILILILIFILIRKKQKKSKKKRNKAK